MNEDDAAAAAERLITTLERIREDLPDLECWADIAHHLDRIASALEHLTKKPQPPVGWSSSVQRKGEEWRSGFDAGTAAARKLGSE